MALSFDEIIARANAANPTAKAHVFIEYADRKRGYFRSYPTLKAALRYCNSREGERLSAQAYGKNGEDVN